MKKKFNIIDLLIIIIALVVICAVVWVLRINKTANTGETRTIVMEIKQKSESFCTYPKEGDIITDAATKQEIGTLVGFQQKPATINLTSSEEGKFVESDIEGYYDVYLTIELHSNLENAKVGKSMYIQSQQYAGSGYVVNVLESEGDAK